MEQQQTLNLILQELNTINNNLNTLKKRIDLILQKNEDPNLVRACPDCCTRHDITKILTYLDTMDNKIDDIKGSTENMDHHISFIEKVYDTVAQPFTYIFNKLSYKNHIKLPELPSDKTKHIEYNIS